MINELKNFFKPSIPKIIYALAVLTWQFFYNFQKYDFGFVGTAIKGYVEIGFGAVSWGNFFIRNISLLFVWIIVALIIYLFFISWEFIGNIFHNLKVKLTYQNQSPADYGHLLRKSSITLKSHLISHLLLTGGVFLFLLGFFFMSNLVEKFRFSLADRIFWQMIEGGAAITYDSLWYTVVSFVATLPFWYFYSCLVFFIFREGKVEEDEADITDEHYAAVI